MCSNQAITIGVADVILVYMRHGCRVVPVAEIAPRVRM